MTAARTFAVVLALVVAGCLGGSGATNVADEPVAPGTATTATEAPTPATASTTRTGTTDSPVPVRSYDDRESLAEAAPFAVPDPDVPAPFAFDSGIVSTAGNETRVSVAYHHVVGSGEDAEVRNVLSVGRFAGEALDLDRGEAVTVDGREMRYVEDGDRRTLLWRCGGYTHRVSVQQFDETFGREELSEIAASAECPETAGEEP